MVFIFLVKKLGGYYNLRSKYNNTRSKFIKKILFFINKGYQHETNSNLPFNNVIEGPINFLHGTYGIFISGGARIGKNCTIYHQVTIGSNMLIDSKGLGYPTIGDNCLIGAGAKIIGNVKIGNNCRIGANAVVTQDLPDNTLVVLGKPVVIQKENMINRIYQNPGNVWGYIENGKFIIEQNKQYLEILNRCNP